jgi:PAS domain S-box-containing protein
VLSRHLPFGLVVIDRDGRVSYANDAVRSLLGHPFDADAGFEAWLECGAPEELQREPILREWRDNVWRRQLARVFSLATAEGLLKEIELRPRLLSDGRLLVTISDVTEARRSEDALRTSEIKYRGLFQRFPASIALADRAGVIIDANPALEQLTGHTRAELRRLRLHDLFASDPQATGPERADDPVLVRTRQGETVPALVSVAPICNVAGETVLEAFFIQPEPKPKASEPAAAEPQPTAPEPSATAPPSGPAAPTPEAWQDLAFDNLRTALMVTDLRGRVRAANPAALRFFGYDRESLLGGGLYRLFRPDDPAGFSREVSERINLFRCWEGETPFVRADGTTGRCLAEVTSATGSNVPGLLCVVRPIFESVGR